MAAAQSYSATTPSPYFYAKDVGKKNADGTWLFRHLDLELDEGVLTITGPSGVGKSTLLKCLNQTITMDEGQVWLQEKTPDQWGVPTWRSRVMYIPQRTAIMDGTPLEFVQEVRNFNTHKQDQAYHDDPVQIALDWGIRPELWHSRWNTLSGGEMQRISLAIGLSFHPDVLLLDEPTSALDEESCSKVEETLKNYNCIWVTHNPQQAKRITSAGQLVMRGGDQSGTQSPTGIVVDQGRGRSPQPTMVTAAQSGKIKDGHGHANGSTRGSSPSDATVSSGKNTPSAASGNAK